MDTSHCEITGPPAGDQESNKLSNAMSAKGYLPHSIIKGFVFWILSFCLAAATASGILREWGTIGDVVAGRCLWTAFILALGSVAFLFVNYLFGDLGQMLFGKGEPPPSADPAFAERLRMAKVGGPHRDRQFVKDDTDS